MTFIRHFKLNGLLAVLLVGIVLVAGCAGTATRPRMTRESASNKKRAMDLFIEGKVPEAKEKYAEAQRLIVEDAPYVFLFYQKGWSGQNKRIQGIEPTALGIGWNSEDWYIEEQE